jgi:hypothetical protein
VECSEWEGRTGERDVEVRQIGKETDNQVKYYATSLKPAANTSRKVNLLELGKLWQCFRVRKVMAMF